MECLSSETDNWLIIKQLHSNGSTAILGSAALYISDQVQKNTRTLTALLWQISPSFALLNFLSDSSTSPHPYWTQKLEVWVLEVWECLVDFHSIASCGYLTIHLLFQLEVYYWLFTLPPVHRQSLRWISIKWSWRYHLTTLAFKMAISYVRKSTAKQTDLSQRSTLDFSVDLISQKPTPPQWEKSGATWWIDKEVLFRKNWGKGSRVPYGYSCFHNLWRFFWNDSTEIE